LVANCFYYQLWDFLNCVPIGPLCRIMVSPIQVLSYDFLVCGLGGGSRPQRKGGWTQIMALNHFNLLLDALSSCRSNANILMGPMRLLVKYLERPEQYNHFACALTRLKDEHPTTSASTRPIYGNASIMGTTGP